jgi:DNA-binding NarL/FixJ family response regulator
MRLTNEVQGRDRFLASGVELLMQQACRGLGYLIEANSFKGNALPDVWVLSPDKPEELYAFVKNRSHRKLCVIFCDCRFSEVLKNLPESMVVGFFDVNAPVRQLINEVRHVMMKVISGNLPCIREGSIVCKLSAFEEVILLLLMKGKVISEIAIATGANLKYISHCKRNIMNKMHAYSNQELFLWATALGYNSVINMDGVYEA